jgi:glyceraldehyde 3-phosphate dehydrogenase
MRVAINGFGRIGRAVFKLCLEKKINVVAVNDLLDNKSMVYLLKYDSVYGRYDKEIKSGEDFLKIGSKRIKLFDEEDPEKLPWKKLKVDVVIEATGKFRRRKEAMKHINAGAKKVVISAPAESADATIILGVNGEKLKKKDKIISVASCTTNALTPVVKVLNDEFGIEKGSMVTAHAYTTSQGLVDSPAKKTRRGRAAAINIVPTTSGATKAVVQIMPELKGKLDGFAMRVPVATGSVIDFVAVLKKKTNASEINKLFEKASKGKMKGILSYSEDEIVSSDVIGDPHSSVVDGISTHVVDGNLARVLAFYDNEYGYSNRLVDVVKKLR